MATIEKRGGFLTLINVFSVAPDNQAKLIELLIKATEETMKYLPGFVSANIHRSFDGRKVVNYAQWKSMADFESMRKNPLAVFHIKAAAALAEFEPILCEVCDSVSPK